MRSGDTEMAQPRTGAAPLSTPDRERILLAHHDADMRNHVGERLAPLFDVQTAANGLEALEAIRAHRPDLVLSDILMPRLDGFELLRRLRTDPGLAGLPVILLSARAGEAERVRGLQAGADDYLVKPFGSRELMARVTAALKLARTRRDLLAGQTSAFLERAAASEALSDSEERLRLATEHAEIGFWDVDPVRDVLIWPPIVRAMFGISTDMPIAIADFYAGLHPDDCARVRAEFEAACDPARRSLYDVEYRTIGKEDGVVRWVAAKGRAIFDASGACVRVTGVAIDITARNRVAQRLAESEERLRLALEADKSELERLVQARTRDLEQTQARVAHLQRMEALGQLAGGIAHDFNNVLQAVQGAAGLIEQRAADPDSVRRLARMVLDAASRGSAVTRRLLAFSRRGDLRATPVDPLALLTDMREILAHTLGAGIRIHIESATEMPPMLVDRGQLETVLINMATNARDAMAGNGTLSLAAAVETIPQPCGPRPVRDLKPGRYVRLSVSDTGAGMAPAILGRVAEPFFTTKPQGEGTGLGLAMARGFLQQSGGGLLIESEPGRGTVLHLWLPVADAATAAADAPEPRAPGRAARLLLVDDEALVRDIVAQQLAGAGHEVRAVGAPAEALALLDSGEPFDLLVADLSMPGMDGLTLVREAKRRRPLLPAILLTGFATDAAALAMDGATGNTVSLLRKPVTEQELNERVTMLLEAATSDSQPQPYGG